MSGLILFWARTNFRTIDRETRYLLPPWVDRWLPERHLARFIGEVIDRLDVSRMSGVYRGSGSASCHSQALLGILVYGYATGVFSSRKLERATDVPVAFRFLARRTIIPTTTRSRRFCGVSWRRSRSCSSTC
jgi:transposase